MIPATCTHSNLLNIDDFRESINDSIKSTLYKARSENQSYLLSLSYPIDEINLLQWLRETVPLQGAAFYWEYPLGGIQLAAHTPALKFTAEGHNRFEKIEEEFDSWKRRSYAYDLETQTYQPLLHALGAFSFFDNIHSKEWSNFGPAYWFVPKYLIRQENGITSLILTDTIAPDSSFDGLFDFFGDVEYSIENNKDSLTENIDHSTNGSLYKSSSQNGTVISKQPSDATEYEIWKQNVSTAKNAIKAGELDKIVLSRSVNYHFKNEIDPFKVIENLRANNSNCYTFLLKNENSQYFVGSTPELLTNFNKDRLYTESLAGSIRRGDDHSEEKKLEDYLLNSHKERAEHHFVVNAISKALQEHVRNFRKSPHPIIRKLHSVQHLLTTLQGNLKDGSRPFSILQDLHPTPAVGGSPTEGVRERIRELELSDRGLYSGPIGWINEMNQGTFTVAIRCGLIYRNTARLYAGCGIVEDSVSEREWEEADLKLKPMENALYD